MPFSSFMELVNNAALLLAIGLLYDTLEARLVGDRPVLRPILTGLVIGLVGIAVMLTPLNFGRGIVFDTRSVLLCVSGFFFGTIPCLVAVSITSVYRLTAGGVGAWAGVAVIVTSGGIGMTWRHFRYQKGKMPTLAELYLLGVVTHVGMLACMLLMPWPIASGVLTGIWLPVMLIYPLATALLGQVLANREKRKRVREALIASEEKYRLLAEHSEDVIFTLDMNLAYTYVSPSVKKLRGFDPAEVMAQTAPQTLTPESFAMVSKVLAEELEMERREGPRERPARMLELQMNRKDGSAVWTEVQASILRDEDGRPTGILGVTRDISSRKHVEASLREGEERLRAIFEANANPMVVYDANGYPQYLNPAFSEVFGWNLRELEGRRIPFVPEDQKELTAAKIAEIYADGRPAKFLSKRLTKAGHPLDVIVSAAIIRDAAGEARGMVVNLSDISEQRKLELQLRQAQKMESVGRLAGGVAHDFNNMLNVIIGNAELAMAEVEPENALHSELAEILSAARRSTDIVRQLLAFARQQTIAPQVLDLNETVEGMLKMLRRLIGEDIDLAWLPETGLWPVKVDPSQVDQILANLCVNARDAITGVGKVTIETENITFDESYCADHPESLPGDFVLLSVSDDGCGMSKEVLSNIFEPFFTTKGVGEGTGLGLATVFGIVKQNDGSINVYSEHGKGTSVKIYLPRHEGPAPPMQAPSDDGVSQGRGETVLVVEDEPAILKLSKNILENLGYRVLTAATPDEAISLAKAGAAKIDLLITDVVMPGMNGRELEHELKTRFPRLGCIFMSGYSANVIAHRGILDENVDFIPKPFSRGQLAAKVRRALDAKAAEGA